MNNIFIRNSLNAMVSKLQVILLMLEVTEKLNNIFLTKCSKYNTFQVINDLVLSKNLKSSYYSAMQ